MNDAMLAFYLHTIVGDLARIFGWSPENESYDHVIEQTKRSIDKDDLTSVEDTQEMIVLLTTAEYELWRYAEQRSASFHAISTADGERRDRKQIHDNIVAQRRDAERRLNDAHGHNRVRVDAHYRRDPYVPLDVRHNRIKTWWS